MEKALKVLKILKKEGLYLETRWIDKKGIIVDNQIISETIQELESLQAEYKEMKEYYFFARNHLESYRCKCGALGRKGYLCSNKDCKYE